MATLRRGDSTTTRNSHTRLKEQPINEQPSTSRPGRLWLRLFFLLMVVVGCGTAVFILYGQWLRSGVGGVGGGSAELTLVERVYLSNYLDRHADALQQPAGTGSDGRTFVIAPGETADTVTANLAQAQLLQDEALFRSYLRFYGLDAQLEAGEFTLSPQLTIPELAAALTEAQADEVTLTLIEGWRVEEMADYLRANAPATLSADDFLAIAQRRLPLDLTPYDFLASHPLDASLEGFLFPDTYRVPADADAAFLVDLMLRTFGRRVTPAMRQSFGVQGLTLREAVTLASIVEREAVVAAERPLMAGVFLNRLNQGIKLEADPTVQYPLGFQPQSGSWWKSPLTLADLQQESAYNTYVIGGLPPGPIANPGLAALEAVAAPTATEFIFFVVDCTAAVPGSHAFSVTYEEHLANVQRCR